MSGIESTVEIKKLEAFKQPRAIIGVTADVMPDTKERCIAAGMQECITKPVQHEILKQKMYKYLNT